MKIRKSLLVTGITIAAVDFILIGIVFFVNSELAIKILSMVSACHIGGRMAFISSGFELGLETFPIILIILLYNTAYFLIVYASFILLSEKIHKFKFLKSIHEKIGENQKIRSNWNILSIVIFIWIPLPMTGAVIGALIAYFEGYKDNQIITIALSTMWFGVITWTIAFEKMYRFLQSINSNITFVVTMVLLILPIVYNLTRRNSQK